MTLSKELRWFARRKRVEIVTSRGNLFAEKSKVDLHLKLCSGTTMTLPSLRYRRIDRERARERKERGRVEFII